MSDLFSHQYPKTAGWREPTTSRDAANAVEPKAKRLRPLVIEDLLQHPASTADEVAARLGETVLSIRPRISELKTDCTIEKTGIKRRNESGLSAHTWRVRGQQSDPDIEAFRRATEGLF
jgi:hypothetical protein